MSQWPYRARLLYWLRWFLCVRLRNAVWYALHRRRLSEAELEIAARDSLALWETTYDSDEELVEFMENQVEGFGAAGDHAFVALYARVGELARQRYKRPAVSLPPPPGQFAAHHASLPRTGSREFRPQRRASKALAHSGDDPPDESDSPALGRARGRRGVETA